MREVAYEIKCEGSHHREKDTTYGGETCKSIAERFDEHLDVIIERKSDTPIYKHFVDEHDGATQPISLTIIKNCSSSAMLRQATEAVYIQENDPIINRRSEMGNMNVAKKR